MSRAAASHSIPAKILLPIDFSASSDAALAMATDLAQHFGSELHLLNVIPMLPVMNGIDSFPETQFPFDTRFLHESKDRAEQKLAKCITALVSTGVRASFDVEIGNDVVGNIMAVIEGQHIDMVVISTHGISGWRPLVFGSIAEKSHQTRPVSATNSALGRVNRHSSSFPDWTSRHPNRGGSNRQIANATRSRSCCCLGIMRLLLNGDSSRSLFRTAQHASSQGGTITSRGLQVPTED